MRYFVIMLFLVSTLSHATESLFGTDCEDGICVEDGTIHLTEEDTASLKAILKIDELPELRYEVISIKSIISGSVYLLTTRKPDYYGIEIVLSKEEGKWIILKKVKSLY